MNQESGTKSTENPISFEQFIEEHRDRILLSRQVFEKFILDFRRWKENGTAI